MPQTKTLVVPLTLLTSALVACSDDSPAPADVRTAIHDDLGHILRETKAAADASTVNMPTGAAFGFATSLLGSSSSGIATRMLAAAGDDGEDAFDPDAIVDQLEHELFTDANHLGEGVYRVPASLVCTQAVFDETTGMTTESIDAECASELDKMQLRIRVANDGDSVRFFVQVDANHDEPLSLLLEHDKLAVTLNLDDASEAMTAIAPLLGESAPNVALAGAITGTLEVLGTAHAKVAVDFDRDLSVKLADDGVSLDGPDALRFASAAARVLSIDLDGGAPKASLGLGLGTTTAHLPGDELSAATDFALGGATLNAEFVDGALQLTNVSLGNTTTTVSVGGQTAMAIDLNPDAGRAFAATITADPATGSETVVVSPRFDLRTQIDHALLGDDAPVYDVTQILVDGSLRGDTTGQLEVLAGTFSMTTNPASYGFSATRGECVQQTDNYDEETFTSYTTYSVGTCQ